MRLLIALLLVVAACSSEVTKASSTTTPTSPLATRPADTTTSTPPSSAVGHLIKLDPLSLEPIPGLEPIQVPYNSWNPLTSPDGSIVVNFEWDEEANNLTDIRVIDVESWKQIGTRELGPMTGAVIGDGKLYLYRRHDGSLLAIDLATGHELVLSDWSPKHWLGEGLVVLPEERIAGIAAEPVAAREEVEHSVFVLDLETRTTTEHPIGPLERVNLATGVFAGEYEIPETDYPGVVWDDDRLLLAYMDGPEVVEIDLHTGATRTHMIELSSWWDRLWTFWMPSASAKGPSLGTNTSAVLSPDGSYLFISGNEQTIEIAADGTLLEGNEHLGLVVVDTETWRSVATPDVPIQYVFSAGVHVIGVNTTSFQPWTDDYYFLSIDQTGTIEARGPLTIRSGSCEQTSGRQHLLCTEHRSGMKVRLVDIETLETLSERVMHQEDTLLPNGVLVDRPPRLDP